MSAIGAILAGVAAKVGAELVGKALGDRFGPAGGALAETVIGQIAERAGVAPAQLPEMAGKSPQVIEQAVVAVEAEMPEIILAHVEQQKATHAFLSGEKPRPGWVDTWQWFLMGLWAFNGLAVTIVNAIADAGLERLPWEHLVMLTLTYQGLNMGGHTALRLADKWRGGRA